MFPSLVMREGESGATSPGRRRLREPTVCSRLAGSTTLPTAADYRAQAARCRRLADGFWRADDPTVRLLLEMALELDAKALEADKAERGRTC